MRHFVRRLRIERFHIERDRSRGENAPASALILDSRHAVARIKMVNYDAIRLCQSSPKSSLNGSPMIPK